MSRQSEMKSAAEDILIKIDDLFVELDIILDISGRDELPSRLDRVKSDITSARNNTELWLRPKSKNLYR